MWGERPGLAAIGAVPVAAAPQGRIYMRGGNPGDLLIVQTPEVHAEIETLLRYLRAATYIQVNVEARFLEVSTDFLREVGTNLTHFTPDVNAYTDSVAGVGNVQKQGFMFQSPSVTTPGIAVAADGSVVVAPGAFGTGLPFMGTGFPYYPETPSGLNLSFAFFDDFLLTGVFRASQSRKGSEVLSAPNITLMNGMRGYLAFSRSWNYVGGFEISEGLPVPEIASVSSAITLDVRPVVSHDRRYVYLELSPSISDVLSFDEFSYQTAVAAAGAGDGAGAVAMVTNIIRLPVQETQDIQTTVCVPDKGILAIGGLSKSSKLEREEGVPVLSKIPILRRLFSGEGQQLTRDHLLILVRPRVIIQEEGERAAY